MTCEEVMRELESYSDERTKQTLMRHGAREPFFGVKVQDLKKNLKKTKKNHELSLDLYKTGNSDAMYLAGLMADESRISKADLEDWVKNAYWSYLSEYAVPWVAAETPHGLELGLKWIDSKDENIASAGWSTLAYFTSVNEDDDIPLDTYRDLLKRVENTIDGAQNRERYTMNGFVIAVGTYVQALNTDAVATAKKIGKITVDMDGTACKVPLAVDYIDKVVNRGTVGKKRKTARC